MYENRKREEANLNRIIERLNDSINTRSVQQLLPAVTYTCTTMNRYLLAEENQFKRGYYLLLFTKLIQDFEKKVSQNAKNKKINLTVNRKTILTQILFKCQKFRQQNQGYQGQRSYSKKHCQQEFNSMYQEMLKLYQDHNLDFAAKQIEKMRTLQKQYKQIVVTKEKQKRIDEIEKQYVKMVTYYGYLDGGNDWIFDKQQNGTSLSYKVLEEERTILVKMEADIEMQMLPFLAIISEIDFQHQYVPFVYDNKELKQISRNQKAGYSKTYMPLLTDRECYFAAVGYDRIKTTGSIFLYTQTYDQNEEFQRQNDLHVPKASESDLVRLIVNYFCIDFKPLSHTRAKIRIVTNSNLQLNYLPLFILQRLARIFTFNYFSGIVAKARAYKGSIWEKRVKERPDMYNFFQSKIDQYFK